MKSFGPSFDKAALFIVVLHKPSFPLARRLTVCVTLTFVTFKFINPESLGAPRGYANGILAGTGGKLLFVAGQIGWNGHQALVSNAFDEQFDQALANVLTVVTAAGGTADNVARLVIYVTDKNEYKGHLRQVGERYRAHMGKHFPAMVLVEVKSLLDDAAKVEIEAIAVLPA